MRGAGRDAADDPEAQHKRQHLCASGRAVAQIAAVGDDMDLRHRHRDAASKAGDGQQSLQHARRQFDPSR
jgi:hypothetical protein